MSKFAVEFMMILIAAVVPAGLLIVYLISGRREEEREEEAGYYTVPIPQRYSAVSGIRPVWFLELTNVRTGVHIGKRFSGYILLGRLSGDSEPTKFMYLDASQTISRTHCRVSDTDRGVTVENLSRVNGTRLNGYLLQRPGRLQYGDFLDIGSERYIVTALRRAA